MSTYISDVILYYYKRIIIYLWAHTIFLEPDYLGIYIMIN